MKLDSLVDELSREDWRKIRQLAQGQYVTSGSSHREADWFLAKCFINAFIHLLYSKGYRVIKEE